MHPLETSLLAQTPLARPLAEFDKLVAQLTSANVVGEPMRAGDVTVIPFAAIQFGVGRAGATIAVGGGMRFVLGVELYCFQHPQQT